MLYTHTKLVGTCCCYFHSTFTMSSKKLSSTKVNVNYVENSIDIFKFYQRVLNVWATRVTISWLHYQIYHILVALT